MGESLPRVGSRHGKIFISSPACATQRVVMLSSIDVYRAMGILHGTESGPLQEVPLRKSWSDFVCIPSAALGARKLLNSDNRWSAREGNVRISPRNRICQNSSPGKATIFSLADKKWCRVSVLFTRWHQIEGKTWCHRH